LDSSLRKEEDANLGHQYQVAMEIIAAEGLDQGEKINKRSN